MEEQFYLVWPAIEKYLKVSTVLTLLGALLVVNQACNFGWFESAIIGLYGNSAAITRPIFLITFTPILLGVLAAHAMHRPSTGRRLCDLLGGYWTPALLLLGAIGLCELSSELQGLPRLGIHLLFGALLLALVIPRDHVFARVLQSRPLAYLGRISYGLYLYHVFVIYVLEKVATLADWRLAPWLAFAVTTALSTALAGLSFKTVEEPLIRLAHRRRAQPRVAAGRS